MAKLNVVARQRPEDVGPFDLWDDPAWQRHGRVRSTALAGEQFSGRLEHGTIAFLSVCRISATGHRVEHRLESGDEVQHTNLKVLFQLFGNCRLEQGDRVVDLTAGEAVIYDANVAYTLVNPRAVQQIVVSIPEDSIALRAVPRSEVLCNKLSVRAGCGRLALGLLQATLDELPNCNLQGATHAATSICHLLADAVREQVAEQRPVSLKQVLRSRVRDYIDNNLADPDLSVDQIAARLNCSKRYLYEVFEDSGLTLARYIWKRRLERCRDELVDTDRAERSLTDIAYSWGFRSLPHFSKAFKQEFGASPSDFKSR